MIDRAVPYMALAKRVVSVGVTVSFLSATANLTTGAKVLETLPLGPSTWTVESLMSTLTLSGRETGSLPMRRMVRRGRLPNVADQLPAGLLPAAVGVLEEAFRGGDDGDPEAVEDA